MSVPFPKFDHRFFEAADPFGRVWQVEFRWQQTGISIRHADTVDVKYSLFHDDHHGVKEELEKVIALPHPHLLALAKRAERPLTDAWCLRLANAHLQQMIETWEDMDKVLVTLTAQELDRAHASVLKQLEAA
ncbi:MAG: hypothetical protein K2Q23_12770 [Bryobacteraceae bacterium]|nr:hypothetical protein [Bryobacteraceae bacterium]